MTIKVGDKIPEATLMRMTDKGPVPLTTKELFDGKKVVLFAVPGAFTPTCSNQHLPGFVEKANEIKAKGVDTIACVSVNDAFVMGAWGKDRNVGDKVLMLGDGSAAFSKAVGLDLDLSKMGLGVRSRRYSMLVENGVVKQLNIEEAPAGAEKSGAGTMLQQL